MNIIVHLWTWIEIHIFKRHCLNCKNVEILDKPTPFMEEYFCDNAMDYDGLTEPGKEAVCNQFKRKRR